MPLFNEICHLAETHDAEALASRINEERICIDVQKGIYTPVVLLAQQKKEKAVTFLINKFNANRDNAVWGYAIGGHTEQVNALLAQGANRDDAIRGYAQGGHTEQVNALLAQGAKRHNANWGYAIGGHTAQVNALLAQGGNRDDAVRGYAIGGHTEQVNALLAQGADRDNAVRCYAVGGHTEQVNALLAQGANRNYAVRGYAFGGHTEQVNMLLAQGANRNWALMGYAQGGHTEQVNALLAQGANRDDAIRCYKIGGHIANQEKLLHVMASTDDLALRNKLAQTQHNISTALLKKANKLNRLMRENRMSYAWARVWEPALQGLFLLGAALLQEQSCIKKNGTTTIRPALNLDILLHISSYLSGFSNEVTLTFLNRHTQPLEKNQSYKMGKHTLFMREKALISNDERHTLFLSKIELTAILANYQSTSYFSKLSEVFNSSAIKRLKTLLTSEKDVFSYEDILRATRSHLNQLDNPSIQNGTKKVLKAIRSKFDDQAVVKQVIEFK